jgi:alanine racemase
MQLRNGGITLPILILGYTPPSQTGILLEYKITQTVYDSKMAEAFSKEALRLGGKLAVHIKIDTGMSRLGLRCHGGPGEDCLNRLEEIWRMEGLYAEGIFTHFASSDEPENPFTLRQFEAFCRTVEELEKRNITFSLRHCANSAAIINFPMTHLDMVRPGIILYGLPPDQRPAGWPLQAAMKVCSVVSAVHDGIVGDTVSYGQTFLVEKPMRLATVAIGYADGYPRRLSDRGIMLIGGRRVPIVGRICMDQCVVDISDAGEVKPGDTVVVMGEGILAEDIARKCDTINYEIICGISKRVPRVYVENGKAVKKLAYIV